MGWIGGMIDRYDSKEQIENHWYQTEGELPARMEGCNKLVFYGAFNTEKEGRAALERADIFGMGYVRIDTGKKSAKLKDAEELLTKEQKKLDDYLAESSVYKTHNGKTVGCQRCKSSFPVDYFKREKSGMGGWRNGYYIYPDRFDDDGKFVNSCPICGAEMRSDTAIKRINGYRANIDKYKKRVKEIQETEKNKPFYLGKVNAYCG